MSSAVHQICLFLLVVSSSHISSQAYKIIDLSHPLNKDTIYWPGHPRFQRSDVFRNYTADEIWINSGAYSTGEHGGTHVDSPIHFYKDGMDLKDLPIEKTIAEGVVVDCREEAEANMDYALTLGKLQEWEVENGRIPDDAAVLVYFGYAQKFSDPKAFFNTEKIDDVNAIRFPFIGVEAAKWLVEKRKLRMIGMDVASPDGPQEPVKLYPIHNLMGRHNILILENVNIPATLPTRDFRLHASPTRIEDGTGTPTRIYAMLNDRLSDGAATPSSICLFFVISFSLIVNAVLA